MSKTYNIQLFECECGYYTTNPAHANKHSKTSRCLDKKMLCEKCDFVKKTDIISSSDSVGLLNNGTVNANVINNIITNVYLPENALKEDMEKYMMLFTGWDKNANTFDCIEFPGKLFARVRRTSDNPDVIIAKGDKIIEKLPDGGVRKFGRKKATKVYMKEAVDAICKYPPDPKIQDFYMKDRGFGEQKITLQDGININAIDSVGYHHKVPSSLKETINKVEKYVDKRLGEITTSNSLG